MEGGKEDKKKDDAPPQIYALAFVDNWNGPLLSKTVVGWKGGGGGWYLRPQTIASEYIRVMREMKQNPPPLPVDNEDMMTV